MRALRGDEFLVSVDQEGGPVQRFREGFTRLPALARIGALYDRDPVAAIARAEEHAWVMASEMRACGVDFQLRAGRRPRARQSRRSACAPSTPTRDACAELAQAYVRGMHLAGMAATAQAFPRSRLGAPRTRMSPPPSIRARWSGLPPRRPAAVRDRIRGAAPRR